MPLWLHEEGAVAARWPTTTNAMAQQRHWRARRAGAQGHRAMHGTSPASGIHPLFGIRSIVRPGWARTPSEHRQLCDTQASQSPRLGRTASEVPVSLRPDPRFPGLSAFWRSLRQTKLAAAQARCLGRRTSEFFKCFL